MISTHYIANANLQMDLELRIIRHFLLHPHTKEARKDARDSFVASEMKIRSESMERVLKEKGDRDFIDDMLAPSILRGQKAWLENNLHHLKEFSENRLNQMELILRYSLFEGMLGKIIGNILWENPELRENKFHLQREWKRPRYYDKKDDPELDRISWTKAVVGAVDRLPFDKWDHDRPRPATIYFWMYLRDGLGLTWNSTELWATLEKLHQTRIHLVHKSLELTISNERVKEVENYLGNFPTILASAAAKKFPNACTDEKMTDDDDGTPGYFLKEKLLDYDVEPN
jgi:hypothetical protein